MHFLLHHYTLRIDGSGCLQDWETEARLLACIRYYSPMELVATKPIRLAKLLFIYIVLAQPKGAGYLYLLLLQFGSIMS